MTIFEPAALQLAQPDAEPQGMMECRIHVTSVRKRKGRIVVNGIDLNTMRPVSFFADQMQNVREIPR